MFCGFNMVLSGIYTRKHFFLTVWTGNATYRASLMLGMIYTSANTYLQAYEGLMQGHSQKVPVLCILICHNILSYFPVNKSMML